jgi:hypothetical protein
MQLKHHDREKLIWESNLPMARKQLLSCLNDYAGAYGNLDETALALGFEEASQSIGDSVLIHYLNLSPGYLQEVDRGLWLINFQRLAFEAELKQAQISETVTCLQPRTSCKNINPHTGGGNELISLVSEITEMLYPSIVTDLTVCPPLWTKGVYVLLDKEIVVYVGMSDTCIAKRLRRHARHGEMSFNSYTLIETTRADRNLICKLEDGLINFFKPKYNKTYTVNCQQLHVSELENWEAMSC